MTVTRINQAGFESRSIREVTQFGSDIPTISSVAAFTGTYSLRYNGGASGVGGVGFAFATAYDGARIACQLRHGAPNHVSGVAAGLLTIAAAATRLAHVTYNGDTGDVDLLINGISEDSASAASLGLADVDTWRHLALVYQAGTPGYCTFYIDGAVGLTYSGTLTGDIDNAQALWHAGNSVFGDHNYIDDLYADGLNNESDSPPSTRRFLWAVPDNTGADAGWTPSTGSNYQNVDDAPPDDDTTYNKVLTAGARDTFNFASISVPTDHVIRAIIPTAYLRKTDAATPAEISLHAYDGSTYLDGDDIDNLPTAYGFRFARFEAQPDTTVWNETDLNAMQFGYRARGVW